MAAYSCPQCGVGARDRETRQKDELTISYGCGARIVLVRHGYSWTVKSTAPCQKTLNKIKSI